MGRGLSAKQRRQVLDSPAEQARAALVKLAEQQQWPSIAVGPDAFPDGPGLAGAAQRLGVAAPPTIDPAPADPAVAAAEAALRDAEAALSGAVGAGDGDAVLGARRAVQEATVRLWGARRAETERRLAHYEGQTTRFADAAGRYGPRLDEVRARIRDLRQDEETLLACLAATQSGLERVGALCAQAEKERARLAGGPEVSASGRWAG